MRLSEKLREREEINKIKVHSIDVISMHVGVDLVIELYCTVLPIIVENVPFRGVSECGVAGDGKRRHDHQRRQNRHMRHTRPLKLETYLCICQF